MPTLQSVIAEKFFEKIALSAEIDAAQIQQLRLLFETDKKMKVDDLVRVFSLPRGSDIE